MFDLAGHCDRMTRRTNSIRSGSTIVEIPDGWIRLREGGDGGPFPSSGFNRVHWLTMSGPLTREHVDAMVRAVRGFGAQGAYVWMSPVAATGAGREELLRAGATEWPHVRYLALMRRAEPVASPFAASGELHARPLGVGEVPEVMNSVKSWYSESGATAACELAARGIAEIHAVFEGSRAIAIGGLLMDEIAGCGHLGWAGTDPERRSRGSQSALIASRVTRAAELGAAFCVSETNTAVDQSLRNLMRLGFAPVAAWSVWRWQDPERAPVPHSG